MLLLIFVRLQSRLVVPGHRARRHSGGRFGDCGQATAEYALVLLAAAAVALAVVAWAAKSGKITQLFDAVMDQLIGKAR